MIHVQGRIIVASRDRLFNVEGSPEIKYLKKAGDPHEQLIIWVSCIHRHCFE